MVLSYTGGGSGWILGNSGDTLAQAAQESDEVTVPGSVQKNMKLWHWGTYLVSIVMMGWWLDYKILDAFSNHDSMILWTGKEIICQQHAETNKSQETAVNSPPIRLARVL